MTLFAFLIGPLLSQASIDAIGLTGSMMIFAVGVNLVWGKKFSVANMLPTLIFAALWPVFL